MTVVSVADASRRLGIDAKTLHRWVELAHLSLQDHPTDGRKKGVSGEHLALLAHLHHRHLDALPQQPPPCVPPLEPSLPDLPETLCALHQQIAALHQQVTVLTSLLQQHLAPPASPPPPAPLPPAATRSPKPPTSTPTNTPKKPTHVIPRVEYSPQQGRYVVICPKRGLLPFEPDTPEWFAWVARQSSFRFIGKLGHFSAHHEWRTPNGAWRAHRHLRNHVHIQRLAPNQELTLSVLEQAAAALQAHLA